MRPSTTQKLGKTVILGLLAFLLLRPRWKSESFESLVSGKQPHGVWEFVSDLSNAKLLNKYIYDFSIVSEKGNYDHWEYGAVIYETMAHLPLLTNTNYAHFSVKPARAGDENYRISSTYKTCFFSFFCLDSKSEMLFSPAVPSSGTKVRETVEYQCPFVFSWFCAWELHDSRENWTKNLKLHLE